MKTDFQNGERLFAEDLNTNFVETDNRLTATETVANAAIAAPSAPSSGDILTYSGSAWTAETGGYRYLQTVYFTSSGTFTKANYPGLKAVKVRLVGGGGGSSYMGTYSAGASGGGGGYAEKFVLASALSADETVTVGSGGAGGTSTANSTANRTGGASSFGTHCAANGAAGSTGGVGTAGDLLIQGGDGGGSGRDKTFASSGSSMFGFGAPASAGASGDGGQGAAGRLYGAGGQGGISGDFARNGNAGAAGIVIVDLYV